MTLESHVAHVKPISHMLFNRSGENLSADLGLNLLKSEKDPDLIKAIKGAEDKYKRQKMCDL